MRSDRRLAPGAVLRHVAVCLVAAVLAGPAGAERAARVVDVRVGLHRDHTRVVIELDEPSGHHVERSADRGDALAIRLDARGERRRIVSHGPLVGEVTLEPAEGGTLARIALRESGLAYSEMVLDGPPRIVIDVRRTGVTGAARPGRDLAPATAAKPEAPEVGPAPVAASAPAAPDTRDPFEPPASYRALVAAQQAEHPAPQPDHGLLPAPAASSNDPVAGAPAANEPAAGPPAAPPPAAAPAPAPHVLSTPPQSAATPPGLEALLARLRGGLAGLGPAPALLVLALLLLTWFAYRRMILRRTREGALRAAEETVEVFGDAPAGEREAGPSPREVEVPLEPARVEAPGLEGLALVVRDPAIVAAPTAEQMELAVAARTEQAIAADQPEPVSEPAAEPAVAPAPLAHGAPPGPGWQSLAIPPAEEESMRLAPPPAGATVPPLSELERRIAQLEGRIEELLEARERLERYAAAQNEELRVQRAAIARTQRVLRSMVRPEEAATPEAPRSAPLPTE